MEILLLINHFLIIKSGNVVPLQLSIVPPYMDVERGAFVQFACASSNPGARLDWVFEQGELPRTASVVSVVLSLFGQLYQNLLDGKLSRIFLNE